MVFFNLFIIINYIFRQLIFDKFDINLVSIVII